jgi:hypothetical protein
VDVDRVQEFRKCIECFLCQDVCHVLRDHRMFGEFVGPRHLVYTAALEMHPLDTEAREIVARLQDDYERTYYSGLVQERRAKAQLRHATPGCGPRAYEWLREAMSHYERAEAIRPPTNDDALLRWNACARLIMRHRHLVPIPEERGEPLLLE